MVALFSLCLGCLFLSLLLRFDLGFHFHDQHRELFLSYLSCLRVNILKYTFAINSRRELSS